MFRTMRLLIVFALILVAVPPLAAQANPVEIPDLPATCSTATLPDQETTLVCFPPASMWNGDLVLFAHGYVFDYPPGLPPILPYDQIMLKVGDSTVWLPAVLNQMGFGFAMTSYSKNGLAVKEGVAETRALAAAISAQVAAAGREIRHVYVIGASEGGLITTLLMERYPEEFHGGLAMCAPVGDFQKEINYWGNFRAVLDVLFPVLPASAIDIPSTLMADWVLPIEESYYQQNLMLAMQDNPPWTAALITVTQAAVDPTSPATTPLTVKGLLDYNIFATNEGQVELGVQPFDNMTTVYSGAGPLDQYINARIERYPSSGDVAAALAPYQTSGLLRRPLIEMHTTLDPIVPFWHQGLYTAKVIATHSWPKYTPVAISRYGHCNFTTSEMLYYFLAMVYKSSQRPIDLSFMQGLFSDNGQTYQAILALNGNSTRLPSSPRQTFLPALSNH